MFLKSDFIEQFRTIVELEEQMRVAMGQLLTEVTDPVNSRMISIIQQDEIRHTELIKEIMSLIET
ncbi:MAG: hypothetical protein JNL74_12110 [Fibrobacteres bacterium]|nr:hypothetical protein [Fibrobacterota bacterium]